MILSFLYVFLFSGTIIKNVESEDYLTKSRSILAPDRIKGNFHWF